MGNPKYSILMAVYNRESMVSKALRSVLDQTEPDWELLICDDCSTDRTISVISSFLHDPRITLIRNKTNIGAYRSRNKLLDRRGGKYIAFLDSDDYFFPKALEEVELEFIKDTTADIISTLCEDIVNGTYNEDFGKKIRRQLYKRSQSPLDPDEINSVIPKKITSRGGGSSGVLLLCTSFFRSECFQVLRFRGKRRAAEDQALFWDLVDKGFQFRPSNILTYYYRIHGQNLHVTANQKQEPPKPKKEDVKYLLVTLEDVNPEKLLTAEALKETQILSLQGNQNLFDNLRSFGDVIIPKIER